MRGHSRLFAVFFSVAACVGLAAAATSGPLLMQGPRGSQVVGPTDTGTAGTVQATSQVIAPSVGNSMSAQHPLLAGTGAVLTTDSTIDQMPSGLAVYQYLGQPSATSTTGLGSATANSASNSFTGVSSPNTCRQLWVTASANWDGGGITLNGTDCSGFAISQTVFPLGSSSPTSRPWLTLTSATKATVGTTTGTATIGPADGLGIATRHRQPSRCVVFYWNGTGYAVDGNPTVQYFSGNDPYVLPTNVATGSRTYQVVCGLL
jgi:hypothetical protein